MRRGVACGDLRNAVLVPPLAATWRYCRVRSSFDASILGFALHFDLFPYFMIIIFDVIDIILTKNGYALLLMHIPMYFYGPIFNANVYITFER